jgi:hypothetical protein
MKFFRPIEEFVRLFHLSREDVPIAVRERPFIVFLISTIMIISSSFTIYKSVTGVENLFWLFFGVFGVTVAIAGFRLWYVLKYTN